MICTIRDVDCCAHAESLLTRQFQSEAWDLICMYIIVQFINCTYSSIDLSLSFDFIFWLLIFYVDCL